MVDKHARLFSLIDGMILIAAIALGFAGVRAESGDHYHHRALYTLYQSSVDTHAVLNPSSAYQRIWKVVASIQRSLPVVAAMTVAWLIIRLRRPRPSTRSLSRHPGFVALVAVLISLAFNLVFGLIQLFLATIGFTTSVDPRFYANVSFLACQTLQAHPAGSAIVASWTVLYLSRRWIREGDWSDWAGFWMGVGWCLLSVNEWLLEWYL